jgi:hypothetical protein
MNNLVARQVEEVLSGPVSSVGLACGGPLRVAAGTLHRADTDEINATTVVGVVGTDDLATFQKLVADIADEFDLDARVRVDVGSFAVRFSRRVEAPAPVTDSQAGKSVFARLRLMA